MHTRQHGSTDFLFIGAFTCSPESLYTFQRKGNMFLKSSFLPKVRLFWGTPRICQILKLEGFYKSKIKGFFWKNFTLYPSATLEKKNIEVSLDLSSWDVWEFLCLFFNIYFYTVLSRWNEGHWPFRKGIKLRGKHLLPCTTACIQYQIDVIGSCYSMLVFLNGFNPY